MKLMALVALALGGCSTNQLPAPSFLSMQSNAKSVCDVMADPSSYSGRRITVQGFYFEEPHQRLIYGKDCQKLSIPVEHSLLRKGSPRASALVKKFRKVHQTVNIPVVYSGTFTFRMLTSGCADPSCYRYSLEDAWLLAASPPP